MNELHNKLEKCKWWEFSKKKRLQKEINLKKWDCLTEALNHLKKIKEGIEKYNAAYHIK